jgi:hypothetical protein
MTNRNEALVDEALKGYDMEPWLSFAARAQHLTAGDFDALVAAGDADPEQAHKAKLWHRAQTALMKAAGGTANADSTRFRNIVQGFAGIAPTMAARIYLYQAGMAFASAHLVGTKNYRQEHYDLLTRPWDTAFGELG